MRGRVADGLDAGLREGVLVDDQHAQRPLARGAGEQRDLEGVVGPHDPTPPRLPDLQGPRETLGEQRLRACRGRQRQHPETPGPDRLGEAALAVVGLDPHHDQPPSRA
ncbi:MAG: hypothetical protein ACK56F_11170, partial [bacterium]